MKLIEVTMHKYKSFTQKQSFNIENDITTLVGVNESGKTSVLEAIAKTNYFQKDESFKFDETHDYPRREKKQMEKSEEEPLAVTCTYEIDKNTLEQINNKLGEGVYCDNKFTITKKYNNPSSISIVANQDKFIENKTKELNIPNNIIDALKQAKNKKDLSELPSKLINGDEYEKYKDQINSLSIYFENEFNWNNPISEYIYRKFLKPEAPKFLYYDEYYSLPARIDIKKLQREDLEESELKTAKALFELADLNIDDITEVADFEDSIAELEATQAIISEEVFKYWKTNKNIRIVFKPENTNKNTNEYFLNIRVEHKGVSLSLKNRSKGFNWFFSFIVWFKKIQEDKKSNYILLLDEPGLNLHASAQADLLEFIDDLAKNYQIIYTTHSPFMIPLEKIKRVRTILETNNGSIISDGIEEKDSRTLFPLQAALGYDIAQNLFVSKKNLLVEGVSDLVILTALSSLLEKDKRTCLSKDITIVPTGGLEKVASFISLFSGSKLEITCLLDSYTDDKGRARLNKLVENKLIRENNIKFFHDYLESYKKADLEDLFFKEDYLKLFNSAFNGEYEEIKETDLNNDIKQIIIQINKKLNVDRFNHYRPAKEVTRKDINFFNKLTLDNFEKVFKEINKIFKSN